MKYKGYCGQIQYDDEAKMFYGEVAGLKDVITFRGTSVKELEKSFKDSIDFYLKCCEQRGDKPEKPFSGNLRVRLGRDLHARLSREASLCGVSLNSLIIDKLKS
jgi:predicted HicB family RNase H-like nuclease